MKTYPRCLLVSALAALPLVLATQSVASAAMVINSVPYTITTSGDYELGSNLNYAGSSGDIIAVNASNVTIDFKNFYIAGPVGVSNQRVYGVRSFERSNMTIKNGTIAYCFFGVSLVGNGGATTNSVGLRVENMRVTYCTYVGIELLGSPSSLISNCQVSRITGTPMFASAVGIRCASEGATVADCSVSGVAAPSSTNYGIHLGESFAVRNRIASSGTGIFSNGGKYKDNLTLNCNPAFSGGTDAGGNN